MGLLERASTLGSKPAPKRESLLEISKKKIR